MNSKKWCTNSYKSKGACDGTDRNEEKGKSKMGGKEKEEIELRDRHIVNQFATFAHCSEPPLRWQPLPCILHHICKLVLYFSSLPSLSLLAQLSFPNPALLDSVYGVTPPCSDR